MSDHDVLDVLSSAVDVVNTTKNLIGSATKIDPTADTNIPINSKRLVDVGSGLWRFQSWNGSVWLAVAFDATTLQGSALTDIVYSAGDGIDIDASNVISLEQAGESNLGGVLLAASGDSTSSNKVLSPVRAAELIISQATPVVPVMVAGDFTAAKNTSYLVDHTANDITLPSDAADGDYVRVLNNANSYSGSPSFQAQGTDIICLTRKGNPSISGTTTLTDTTKGFDWIDSAWAGKKVKKQGFPSLVGNITASDADSITTTEDMTWLTNTEYFLGDDAWILPSGSALNYQLIELVYNAAFGIWFPRVSGSSSGAIPHGNDERLYGHILVGGQKTVEAAINAIDDVFDNEVFGNRTDLRTANWNARCAKRDRVDIFTGSSGVTATMTHVAEGGRRTIINAGTASITLSVGEISVEGTTASVLIKDGAIVASSATDITVPADSQVTIHRNQDKFGSAGDDKTAYVWGSSLVTKA